MMEIRAGSQRILEPNATVRMSDGDCLSIAYTDVNGVSKLVIVEARAIALCVRQEGDELFVQSKPYGNVFMPKFDPRN